MARTTALNKIEATLYEPTFYKVIQGGQGAGKTRGIVTLLVGYCDSYPGSRVTIGGVSYSHLEDGAISDFKAVLQEVGRWKDESWNITKTFYKFPNGSEMQFRSFDKMSGRGPRRDVFYATEANSMSFDVFESVANRSKDFVIIDYNPTSKFWAHEELVEKQPDRTSFLILTFEDNEALPSQERANIESHRPKPGEEPSNWWTVYGLGQIGSLEGNVYSGWVEVGLSDIIGQVSDKSTSDGNDTSERLSDKSKLVRYGLDFGFSNDETAMVAVYEMEDGGLGVVETLYKKGMLGSQYVAEFKRAGIDPNVLIVADAARPEIIAEIKEGGFRIVGADKNPGSVKRGIDRVAQRQIRYSGANLKREYLSYAWRKKRTGEVLDEPQDGNDHLMDALRYAVDDLGKQRFDF